MRKNMGAIPGSREPSPCSTGLGPSGFDPERGPFLIWSRKRKLWHRRDEDGGARGYASIIPEAGLFDAKTALEYCDGINNDAYTIEDALGFLDGEIQDRKEDVDAANVRLATAYRIRERFAAIAMEARQGTDPQGLDGEAATARAEGIAQNQSSGGVK